MRVANDAGPDDDSDFIGPRRMRDRFRAGLSKIGGFNDKIRAKFAARQEKAAARGKKRGLGY